MSDRGRLFGRGGRGEVRERVASSLETLPAWQVRLGSRWICPFCTAQIKHRDRSELAERVTDHLDGECRAYEGGRGVERPLEELRSFATYQQLRRQVRQRLLERPSWQLLDVGRQWVCPYCAVPSGVVIPPTSRMDSETLSAIVDHVESCAAYERGRGAERDLPALKEALRGNNQRRQLAAEVRSKLEGDPVWRRKDARGRWDCPYCRRVQDDIDLSSTFVMFEEAPDRIAGHLLGCEPYREGKPPAPLESSREGLMVSGSASGGLLFLSEDDETLPPDPIPRTRRDPEPPPLDAWGEDEDSGEVLPLAAPSEPRRRGATLRELESSGEFLLVDEALPRSGPRGKAAELEVDAWREEIERSLATVRATSSFGLAEPAREDPDLPNLHAAGIGLGRIRQTARPPRGDFAEAIELGAGRLAIYAGGVTGEDADVPMIAALAARHLREQSAADRDPAQVLERVNRAIHLDLDGRSFVSVSYALLDLASGRLRIARAGTSPPLLCREGAPALPIDLEGMVMGIDGGSLFTNSLEVRALALSPGDLLVLYANGLIEGRGGAREELGLERLCFLVERYGRHEVDYFTDKFLEQYERFLGGSPQTQDACLIALKRD